MSRGSQFIGDSALANRAIDGLAKRLYAEWCEWEQEALGIDDLQQRRWEAIGPDSRRIFTDAAREMIARARA